ncbi:uncharacterized protein LOC120432193 [Culex pipiens pallens]|uniref:uncharacterized protein LOC120432193 n=1 Tax=Culex pipiens pallens TaxID=42434 RepID=UPI0022AAA842|nr:uncharacterized protein LOC120432193 [Culex pipiens pallens]XP_052563144.1 uncharacterized protein LOC120432193 [Culex pipiens pallens]
MPYSNGATLRFLLPGPFRGNAQDCNLARQSQSSDSVYRDEADDVLGSITPLAYRPMTNGIMADEDGEDDDGRHRCPATKSGLKDRTADRNPFVISRNINRIAAVILDAITRAIAAPASVLTINIKDQCYLEDDPTIFTKDLEGTVIAALVETPKMETVKVPAVASTITSTIANTVQKMDLEAAVFRISSVSSTATSTIPKRVAEFRSWPFK